MNSQDIKKHQWWFSFSKDYKTITRQLNFVEGPDGKKYLIFLNMDVARKAFRADYLGINLSSMSEILARTSGEHYGIDTCWVRFVRITENVPAIGAICYEIIIQEPNA